MKPHILVVHLALLSIAGVAQAGERMETIVVTGTKTERVSSDAPVATYHVDRSTLNALNTQRADELLRRLPGIQVTKLHGKTGYRVQMQGLEGQHILILLDGQPVPSLSDGTVDISRIPLDSIERIEVVPGASSALHGSQAMGGVIQLFSGNPKASGARIQLEGVSYGPDSTDVRFPDRRHVAVQGSLPIRQTVAHIRAHHTEDEGLAVRNQAFSTTGEQGHRTGGGLSLTHQISNWEMAFGTDLYQQDSGYRYGITSPGATGVATRPWQKTDTLEQVRTQFTVKGGDSIGHELRWLWEENDETTRQDQLETDRVERERHASHRLLNLDVLSQWFAGEDHQWVVGLSANRESLSQTKSEAGTTVTEVPDQTHTQYAFYGQDDFFVSDAMEWVNGVRVQHDDGFGFHTSGSTALRYSWDKGPARQTLRASLGTGYRVPSIKERHYVFDHSALGYQVLGNPDLAPEVSVALQLGWQRTTSDSDLRIQTYVHQLKDLITTSLSSAESQPGLSIFRYQNIGRAQIWGLDVTQRWRFEGGADIEAAWSWLDARNKETDKTLPQRPRHTVNIMGNLPIHPSTRLHLSGRVQSSQFQDTDAMVRAGGWATWDVHLAHSLPHDWTVRWGVRNLTNTQKRYGVENDSRPEEGRTFFLSLSWHTQDDNN